jgi:WD40 repeat protein
LWQVSPSEPVRRLSSIPGRIVAISPDDRAALVAADGDNAMELWDVSGASGPRRDALVRGSQSGSFSPDSRTMVVGDENGVPTLWNVADLAHPVRIGNLIGAEGSVYHPAFDRSGAVVLAGSYDRSVWVWSVGAVTERTRDSAALACAVAGPALSQQDWDRYVPGIPYHRTCN